jgi:hypothetical protein
MIYADFGWAIAQEPSLDRPRDGLFFFVLQIGGEESCDWTDTVRNAGGWST